MNRLVAAVVAFLAMTATFLVLPVYAAPVPAPVPVETATDAVEMGSVDDPAPAADVLAGTTDPVDGVAPDAPVLAVSQEDTGPFSLVGVTWAPDPAVTDVLVQIRTRSLDGTWSGWTEVAVEDADQEDGTDSGAQLRGGTAPLWTGPGTGVEAQLVTRSGAQPTGVTLELVDPGTSAADTALGAPAIQDTADAAMAMPDVYSRAQWGADESIRTWDPEYAPTIRAATLHHTADTNNYTAAQVPAMMRAIYQYHTVGRGWGDIGYNVIADKYGRLWEGRYGGLASTVVGAHAGGFNSGTFGVSMLGNYDQVAVPQALLDAVTAIIAWKFSLYAVDPYGSTTLTSGGGGTSRYAAGVRVTLPTIFGHRDVGSTSCPGQYGYAKLDQIRAGVAAKLATVPTIAGRYASEPGLRATLGAPVGTQQTANGVRWQVYQNGYLVDSAVGGVHLVKGAILRTWLDAGGPFALGGALDDETCADGGCANRFERGAVYWSPGGGTRVLKGSILDRYRELGGPSGPVGWPTSDETCVPGGCSVSFTGGVVAWSPAGGTHLVKGALLADWTRRGGPAGPVGWPTRDETCPPGGCLVSFTGGTLSWTPARGVLLTKGAIGQRWTQEGAAGGFLGWPSAEETCVPGGCSTTFDGGTVYWTPTWGTRVVMGAILADYLRTGGPSGIGFPVTDQVCSGGGCWSAFQVATVFWSPATGAHAVKGSIYDRWDATGRERGYLGWPAGDETCGDGGCRQAFAGGRVAWSPSSGAHVVKGAILDRWQAAGAQNGVLGWPVTDEMCNGTGCANLFSGGGGIFWSPATGARVVKGSIYQQWAAVGRETGFLGWPTGDEVCGGGGCRTDFQGGSVLWSPGRGTFVLKGAILARYDAVGGAAGTLGWPTSGEVCIPGGCRTDFAGGTVSWSPATGARVVTGSALDRWTAAGREAGWLGWPTAEAVTSGGSSTTRFQHGSITTAANGVVTVTPL